MILNRFAENLTNIEYPQFKTSWNIAGIIKGQNAFYKFDVRDMFSLSNGDLAQKGSTNTKADKMVLEIKDEWVILDLKELHNYIKKNKLKQVYLNDILPKLDWTIKLLK
jgi:hypothetical protein